MNKNITSQNVTSAITESPCWETWPRTTRIYSELVCDHSKDSYYLRAHGLKPNLIRLTGDCSASRMLDAGSGNGWLLDALKPHEGYACDIVEQPDISPKWNFEIQDVRTLSYPDNFFDVVVGSLLLIWLEELEIALKQIYRVTKPRGKMVISLVHPYFYRMGEPNEDGDFVIGKDLSRPFKIENLKIGGIAGPLTYFYRPFPDYINNCVKVGFRIVEIVDWFIDMADYERNSKVGMDSKILRTGKVPLYSFIACEKG